MFFLQFLDIVEGFDRQPTYILRICRGQASKTWKDRATLVPQSTVTLPHPRSPGQDLKLLALAHAPTKTIQSCELSFHCDISFRNLNFTQGQITCQMVFSTGHIPAIPLSMNFICHVSFGQSRVSVTAPYR